MFFQNPPTDPPKASNWRFSCKFWYGWLPLTYKKVFKNGPSKICGRQPLKNFIWSILEYFVPYVQANWTRESHNQLPSLCIIKVCVWWDFASSYLCKCWDLGVGWYNPLYAYCRGIDLFWTLSNIYDGACLRK